MPSYGRPHREGPPEAEERRMKCAACEVCGWICEEGEPEYIAAFGVLKCKVRPLHASIVER